MIFGGNTDRNLPVQDKEDPPDGIIYVPAGSTDVVRECDAVINAPFKKVLL